MKTSFFQKNTDLLRQTLKTRTLSSYHWFKNTPERALSQAYEAAQAIQEVEDEHFSRYEINQQNMSPSITSYWRLFLRKKLIFIQIKLWEFNLSHSLLSYQSEECLQKLKFIDGVIYKYTIGQAITDNQVENTQLSIEKNNLEGYIQGKGNKQKSSSFEKTGFLPGSIGRTIQKVSGDLSPQAEEKFLQKFRSSRKKTQIAVNFLLLLIVVPLLTQKVSQQLIIAPIVEHYRGEKAEIFLNKEMEEKAFRELNKFEKDLKFQGLLQSSPDLSKEVREEKIKQKALAIATEFRHHSSQAISNIFADSLSLLAFAIIIITNKKQIAVVKLFMDEIVYGLSDSAKAFIIILCTDVFVGFHSPHGWEVLLEGLGEHLGIAPERSAIFLFIATFPVILDTIFKYWIFRYLSRLSPSALATFKEMNE
ncbi:proton extrusion protein PcxA [Calothrix sp. 336/3]|nr:proton extrusion protein PcxA [Calothrix sp. 336/3]